MSWDKRIARIEQRVFETLPDAVASDPHGSEQHDNEVVHNGDDASLQSLTVGGNTVAALNNNGVVLSSQIPDLAITETYVVADETERLSLDVEEGDVALQQDTDEAYLFTGGDPSVNSNWSLIVTEPGPHSASHEKGGSDELTTFGDTQHDSVSTDDISVGNVGARMEVGSVSTSVDSGVDTTVEFDKSAIDKGGYINLSNNEFQVPTDGVYVLSAVVAWDSPDSSGQFRLKIKSPDEKATEVTFNQFSNEFFSQNLTTTSKMDANDTATLSVEQDTGSSQNVYSGGASGNFVNFQIGLLG